MEEAVLEEAEFYNVAGGGSGNNCLLLDWNVYLKLPFRYGESAERENPQQRQQFWEV